MRSWQLVFITGVVLCFTTLGMAQFVEPQAIVLQSHQAESAGDSFGWVAENIGDIDEDGFNDYVIGAPFNSSNGPVSGRAYVYSGASGDLLHIFTGNPLDIIGFGVAAAGDVNADGVPDYVLGGPALFAPPFAGRVVVLSGADHSVIHDIAGEAGTSLGYDVNGVGDVNSDGYDDFVAGAIFASTGEFQFNGRVIVFSGKTGEELWRFEGMYPGGRLGAGVTGLADIDGDDVPDVAAGALNGNPNASGLTRVFSGVDGSEIWKLLPSSGTAATFGWFFVHDAGDVDADGVTDIYVGDFSDSEDAPGSGRGYVYSGASGGLIRIYDPVHPGEGLGMGRSAGDIDGDGHADLLLGAFTSPAGAPGAGRAYVWSGGKDRPIRLMTGDQPGANLGFDVVTLGDVNGDTFTDFLITGVDVAHVVAGLPLIISSASGR